MSVQIIYENISQIFLITESLTKTLLAHLWEVYAIPMATFLNCASKVLVAPSTSIIKLWLKNHIFTFLTSSLKPAADGASCQKIP